MGLALQEDVLSQSCFASCETPTMATSSSTLASVTSSTSKPAISAKPFPSWSFSMWSRSSRSLTTRWPFHRSPGTCQWPASYSTQRSRVRPSFRRARCTAVCA